MSAPLYELGIFSYAQSLVVAFLIGSAFGFFLERGGLGNARKLAAQFYLQDLTVFKVMFTAILTAMLGLFWLSWLDLLDLSMVYLNPTYLLPQLVGGLVFGAGFVMAGLCPGTSCVAIMTGKADGMVVLIGLFAGIFIFAESFEPLQDFYYSTSLGQISLPEAFGLSQGSVVLLVGILALAGFVGAEILERRKSGEPGGWSRSIVRGKATISQALGLIAFVLALGAAIAGDPQPRLSDGSDPGGLPDAESLNVRRVGALELAGWIMKKDTTLVIIDLRRKMEFTRYHIPYSVSHPTGKGMAEAPLDGKKRVLYAAGETHAMSIIAGMEERHRQQTFLLTGGLKSWVDQVLFPDLRTIEENSPDQADDLQRVSLFFGGNPTRRHGIFSGTGVAFIREGC